MNFYTSYRERVFEEQKQTEFESREFVQSTSAKLKRFLGVISKGAKLFRLLLLILFIADAIQFYVSYPGGIERFSKIIRICKFYLTQSYLP